jgi:hypothetical protein
MKFLLQVRFNGADTMIGELPAGEQQKVTAEFEAIRRSSGVLDGNQLQAADTAATVRMDGGQAQVTKGPAVETGNELDGWPSSQHPPRESCSRTSSSLPTSTGRGASTPACSAARCCGKGAVDHCAREQLDHHQCRRATHR